MGNKTGSNHRNKVETERGGGMNWRQFPKEQRQQFVEYFKELLVCKENAPRIVDFQRHFHLSYNQAGEAYQYAKNIVAIDLIAKQVFGEAKNKERGK